MDLTRKLLDSTSSTLADQRMVKVICSTGEPDRMGDVIVQSGIDLSAYRKNPIVLWGHSADVPIARAVDIDVKDGKLQATVQFPPEGDDEDSDWVYGKIKAGIVNAISVGFIPKEYEPLDPKQPWDGFKFATSELLEFSFVSVPANAGCLIVGRSLFNSAEIPVLPSEARSKGISVDGADISADEVSVPRNILEEVFRQAKTPHRVRQKYLAKAEPEWKVGAARDLPTDDAASWDGNAATKRILDDAGFNGDSPDARKAARGFLIHDSANPSLRGSYKLPFADIVDGTLKAVKAGVSAAKGRLDQTDAPKSVLDNAKAVIDHYDERFGDRGGEDKKFDAPEMKSGRRISKTNEALLRKAMDEHCSNAMKCIKDVLDSIEPDDDEPDDDHSGDQIETITIPADKSVDKPVDERAARLAEVKALRTSLKL